jgi:protein-S-isoprenylcysteine O-methyltransferase Ste14
VTTTDAAVDAPDDVVTASAGSMLRRRLPWIVVAVVVLLAVLVVVIVRSAGSGADDPLSATNPAPDGSRAVVQVLEQHGVHVIPTDSLAATRTAVEAADSATILVFDPDSLMSSDQRAELLSLGTDVVAIEPDVLAAPELAPGVGVAGDLSGSFAADCDLTAVQKAGTVAASGLGYRVSDGAGAGAGDATTCLTKNGASGLVRTTGSAQVTILGLGTALENGTIATKGDAALALNLLGEHPTLVWYISSYADLQEGPTRTLADLTPGWVTPLGILLLIAGIAAAVWRGRRFGPIVVENLPVVVRASETMEGRARLYSRAKARLHALDALRIGTVDRLARAVGLPRTATVDEVIAAVSALTGVGRAGVADVLLDAMPRTDAELVRLSDELLDLEAAVAATSPSEQNGQHG